jgi:uncharacterized membrane protein
MMFNLLAVAGSGVTAGSKYTAQAPPDYLNTIGWSGILMMLVLYGGIMLAAGYVLSVVSAIGKSRGRRGLPEKLN